MIDYLKGFSLETERYFQVQAWSADCTQMINLNYKPGRKLYYYLFSLLSLSCETKQLKLILKLENLLW